MVVLPQWTERITNTDVVGEDHLGVGTAAINQQEDLLPGIISVTDHARYYSFYCWVLWHFINDERHDKRLKNLRGDYFKRLELAHTMACYGHHQDIKGLDGTIGSQKMGVIWREHDPIDLDANTKRYFQNDLGGFGQYYLTAMRLMGLVGEQPNNTDAFQLTARGLELAQAYEASIKHTCYFAQLEQDKDITRLSYTDAAEYGSAACLCANAISHGHDQNLLREVLFRLEDGTHIPSHHQRQLSLGFLLDLVHQSKGIPLIDVRREKVKGTMRYVLYLGEYAPGHTYTPLPSLRLTYEGWRAVQARQLYASTLEIFWAIFLDYLQHEAVDGVTLDEFIEWFRGDGEQSIFDGPLVELKENATSLADWQNASEFAESKFVGDALTRFEEQIGSSVLKTFEPVIMLCDLFVRFYPLHMAKDPVWMHFTVAREESHRLPIANFFEAFAKHLENGSTVREVLHWLYQDYILAQHEYIAIRKLRYNGYDTFKFHYSEGRFYKTGRTYNQPVRHLALRLSNALTMLIDVGLVVADAKTGVCHLSADGEVYLRRVEELNHGA